ncbi:hypothetical protein [Trichloromonas acetexigens]|uniref:hypothetical protein n=1 Tax=Trichloromonas acetexigens TaxID=38815 RepID=UPI001F107145|nr:hypothetical protein [Desulfuromonas acetexigens]
MIDKHLIEERGIGKGAEDPSVRRMNKGGQVYPPFGAIHELDMEPEIRQSIHGCHTPRHSRLDGRRYGKGRTLWGSWFRAHSSQSFIV